MKASDLMASLEQAVAEHGDLDVDVLVELSSIGQVQLEANDVAVSIRERRFVVMHEEFGREHEEVR